ncbi:adenylate kinase family protein [Buchnera aphidicola]|uniref:Adenylate kinase n=1 Tax=Buchnera aphidicola (Sarucallis kahawaluokalani) TaxID=1241878 RepID=A0A4D6YIA7_9GAMM|nr:nucleoside monophosphate kinase [Buchnera aphidicola]QCI26101.1 nucleoside monophosphate kinase [Buchnera aphidicola (Sarucallis kahawaluokalani)]
MKIIIFGPPGSGKGTQSKMLMKKYNIPIISTGEILRKEMSRNNQLGILIKNTIQKGKLIDDNIITKLVIKIIKTKYINKFILDGFPRTKQQIEYIQKKNIFIKYIIELVLSKKIIYERILGRRIHVNSGRTYHIKYHPPKISNQDDITNEKLTTRIDDNIEAINQRLIEYKKIHHIIYKFFQHDIENKNIKYIQINAALPIKEIFSKIEEFLYRN